MIKQLYEIDKNKPVSVDVVDENLEFDVFGDTVTIVVPMNNNGQISDCYRHISIFELPLRKSSIYGSMLITLKEIRQYVLENLGIEHFTVEYQSGHWGAIFLCGNYKKGEWTLYGITNGYA